MERFPPVAPFTDGMLDVGDGQRIYWEASGNPDGKPAVMLHGGPGSGSVPGGRRLFDPDAYLIVQFDQRGSGRSTPHASDPATSLSANTTHHLVADMERLREHLGVERWLVWGGSWGCTLGLVYAERHPQRVNAMVLASVTMTRPADVHCLYHEVGRYFPEQWERFRDGVPEGERDGDLVAAYHRLLNESDDPAFRMAFARIVTHYFSHAAWLDDDQILRDAHRLAGIPGVLIHGRFDLGGPVDTAWQLARAWPSAELHLIATGHAGGEEMTRRTLEATNRFARLGR